MDNFSYSDIFSNTYLHNKYGAAHCVLKGVTDKVF